MAIPPPPPPPAAAPPPQPPLNLLSIRVRLIVKFLLITISCSLFYIIGSYSTITNTATHSAVTSGPACNLRLKSNHSQNDVELAIANGGGSHLDFAAHHTFSLPVHTTEQNHRPFPYCPRNYTDYCPCHDPITEGLFLDDKRFQKERHCPEKGQFFLPFSFSLETET